MYLVTEHGIQGDLQREIVRLESLIADLKHIALGVAPNDEDLEAAPSLDGYTLAVRERPCLAGFAEGHPILGSRTIVTSELWAIAPDLGWARTHSRFYRLGQPSHASALN